LLAGELGVRELTVALAAPPPQGDAPLELGAAELAALPPSALAAARQAVAGAEELAREAREGSAVLVHAGATLRVALLEKATLLAARDGGGGAEAPPPRGPVLIVWREPVLGADADGATREALLEHATRTLQHESRWLRRLDEAQAQLYRDDLTGLFNMRYLELALDAELRRAGRFATQFSLLFLDLDGFKPINDVHGHLAGSAVLKQVADVIRDTVREIDVAIRYGGDEFVVVLLGATCAKGLLAGERLRQRLARTAFRVGGGKTAHLTASIGVAAYPEHGRDKATLLRVADATMYAAKRAGKNRVTVVGREEAASPAEPHPSR
jgi:diguanylate cyclase (GGDEF)-like protein